MTTLLDMTDSALPKGKVKVPPRPGPQPRAPIRVNGVPIEQEAVQTEAQHHPADTPAAAFEAAARALVVRELLMQEATRLGIAADGQQVGEDRRETDEDAAIRVLLEREISTPQADRDACRRYYDTNRHKFRSETLFEARHILIAAAPDDAERRATARREAEALIGALSEEPSRFAELARAHSACPSKIEGGNLGQIGKGSTVPAFEAALTALTPGETSSEPVETPYGFHVIRLERRIDGAQLPFEAVESRIAGWLEASSWSRAVAQYIGILAGKAVIEGIALDAANGPLVR